MLVNCDFSSIEWYVAVELSGDKVGLQEILDGADIHSRNQSAFNLPERRIAKIFLFRLIYGGSCWSYALDPQYNWISDDPDFWQDMIDKFYKKYVDLHRWHEELVLGVMKTGTMETPSGRFYRISRERKREGGPLEWPRPKILNYPVQGFAADIVKLARILLLAALKKRFPKALLVATIHDSLVVDCPNEDTIGVAELMHNILHVQTTKLVEKFYNYKLSVPIKGEIEIGPNLKDMVKWHEPPKTITGRRQTGDRTEVLTIERNGVLTWA